MAAEHTLGQHRPQGWGGLEVGDMALGSAREGLRSGFVQSSCVKLCDGERGPLTPHGGVSPAVSAFVLLPHMLLLPHLLWKDGISMAAGSWSHSLSLDDSDSPPDGSLLF